MTQYVLKSSSFDPTMVASVYNLGLSDGTNSYGYLLQNQGQQSPGLIEKTDVATRDALVNYGSPNLVDRDLTFFPRVSQGDFSGGGLQTVYIEPTRYFDSDLETRFPGYLQLRSQLTSNFYNASGGTQANSAVVAFNGAYYATAADSNFAFYSFSASTPLTTFTAGIVVTFLCTDGYGVYYSDGASIRRWITNETVIANTVNGTISNLWVIQNGTGEYFAYYVNGTTPQQLWKVDLSNAGSFPIAAASHVQMATGGMALKVLDLVAYENGIAILTTDATGSGLRGDVWFHDGVNMTKIVSIEGYLPRGLTNCLGDLYITADQAFSPNAGALLAKIASGEYSIAAFISPALSPVASAPILGRPVTADARVYFLIQQPTLQGIGTGYVGIFDTATAAFGHGSQLSGLTPLAAGARSVAAIGAAYAKVLGSSAHAYSVETQGSNTNFQSTGWMVSSNFDFGTPAIEKRFRTIEVHHAPLNAGEAILVNAYVDLDPTAFTTALTPTATATNSTVGSSTTTLSMGANVGVGHMMYFALQLTAGTSNLTSPKVNYATIEVGGAWTWEVNLDCTAKRMMLNMQPDDQGVTGKDLYFLVRNAYENGTLLTMYLSESVSYTVTIESVEAHGVPYKDHTDVPVLADQEWFVKLVLRQVV